MRGCGGLLTRGADFGEQELHVRLLANSGQMGDWIVSTGNDELFAGLDTGEQVGQMGFRLGDLYRRCHRRGLNSGFDYENKKPNEVGQAVGLITSDKGYLSMVRASTGNHTM